MKHFPASLSTPKSSATALTSSAVFLILLPSAASFVRLHGSSFSLTFVDAPAQFAVPVNASGICGSLHVADPIDACSALRNKFSSSGRNDPDTGDRFVLIERGQCNFDSKVRVAQDAGFNAAIIFDDQNSRNLYSMNGNPIGIHIHAVFVSKSAGEDLCKYADGEAECCIGPLIEEYAGTMLLMSLVLAVIISAITVVIFARIWLILWRRRKRCLDRREVETIPHFIFKRANPNNRCAIETCAICLEDYQDGHRIRLLPCSHGFHSTCVDLWLTKWGTFCPVCKFQLWIA